MEHPRSPRASANLPKTPMKEEGLRREEGGNTGREAAGMETNIGSRAPMHTKIHGFSSLLHKMASFLHITHAHPPMYFKSSLDYL